MADSKDKKKVFEYNNPHMMPAESTYKLSKKRELELQNCYIERDFEV